MHLMKIVIHCHMKVIKVTDKSTKDNQATLDIDVEVDGVVYTLAIEGFFKERVFWHWGNYDTPTCGEVLSVETTIDNLEVFDKDSMLIPLFNTPFSEGNEDLEGLLLDQCYVG